MVSRCKMSAADPMARSGLPRLTLCLATSLDGKISRSPGAAPDFTSRYDRQKLFRLRAAADVLLVGANTVRQEELAPLIRDEALIRQRREAGKPDHPAVVIVSGSLELPWRGPYFSQRRQELFVMSAAVPERRRSELEAMAIGVIDTGPSVCFRKGLAELKKHGHAEVLAEGGGGLNHSLLKQDLVDRLFLTVAPVIIGGLDTPSLCNGPRLETMTRFRLIRSESHEDELHLEYQKKS